MSGIPRRPDLTAWRTMQRRSLTRAATAIFMAHKRDTQAQDILKRVWRDDGDADVILRAATSPLMTTGTFPQIQTTKVLPMLPDPWGTHGASRGRTVIWAGMTRDRVKPLRHSNIRRPYKWSPILRSCSAHG